MIDIISSSIRLGKMLKEQDECKDLSDFFSKILYKKSNPWSCEYARLISSKFSQYGLYSFDVVDQILKQNLDNGERLAREVAYPIYRYATSMPEYNDILRLSQKYGRILNDYIEDLIIRTNEYPQIKLDNTTLKIQQCSNELSTAILRSGVLSWTNDPVKIKLLKKELDFVREYESKTSEYESFLPYNKKTLKVINELNSSQKKIAYNVENIRFAKYLSRCGILQGFFFDLFDISESNILKIKERHKDAGIHPVIIKTDLFFPSNHIFLFRCYYQGRVFYVLTKQMTFHFAKDEVATTTLYGYCYPTNEYSLLRIE